MLNTCSECTHLRLAFEGKDMYLRHDLSCNTCELNPFHNDIEDSWSKLTSNAQLLVHLNILRYFH